MLKKHLSLKGGKAYWFAHQVISTTYDLDAFVQHMHAHNTAYSPGMIKGILQDFTTCFAELLQDGKIVIIDGLGRFRIGITSKQVAKPGDFKPEMHICGAHLCVNTQASGAKLLRSLGSPRLKELPKYVVNKADKSEEKPA
jgi:predicted histone-like DNA-binding protein